MIVKLALLGHCNEANLQERATLLLHRSGNKTTCHEKPPVTFPLQKGQPRMTGLYSYIHQTIIDDKVVIFSHQDISQKLLEACSEIAGASLEQTTWLRRNLAVKPGPQIDVVEQDDVASDLETEGESLRLITYTS